MIEIDASKHQRAATIERSWWLVCVLVTAIFLLRAAALLTVLPPFEGWDEYQHLAHILYVVENGKSPTLGESEVPRSLYPAMAALPHCRLDFGQTHAIGSLPYQAVDQHGLQARSYWDGPPTGVRQNAPSLPLYQAQHGPLYYRLMAPVVRRLWNPDRPLTCIYALRAINVAFGTAAIGVFLWTVGRIIPSTHHRIGMALLIAVQPLFLLNTARIANDALCVLLGLSAAGMLIVFGRAGRIRPMLGAGLLAGLAILAKTTALILLPLAVVGPAWSLARRDVRRARAAGSMGVFLLGCSVLTGGYFYANWRTYGVVVPMQEALINRQAGRGIGDYISAFRSIDWGRQVRSRIGGDSLWIGGWSFLEQPGGVQSAHQVLLAMAVMGLGVRAIRVVRRGPVPVDPSAADHESLTAPLRVDRFHLLSMFVLVIGGLAGLAHHMVHSQMAGGPFGNIWYAAIGFPSMIVLYVVGVTGLGSRRLATALIFGGAGLCAFAESYGLFKLMPVAYTGVPWSNLAKERLASVHPAWLPVGLAMPAQAIALLLVAWVARLSLRQNKASVG